MLSVLIDPHMLVRMPEVTLNVIPASSDFQANNVIPSLVFTAWGREIAVRFGLRVVPARNFDSYILLIIIINVPTFNRRYVL